MRALARGRYGTPASVMVTVGGVADHYKVITHPPSPHTVTRLLVITVTVARSLTTRVNNMTEDKPLTGPAGWRTTDGL